MHADGSHPMEGGPEPPPGAGPETPSGPPLTPEEFERMTADVADRLHAAALRLARNRADADDLVQDTMLRAWRALATFRRGTRFHSWVFRILHNAFLNRRRHEGLAPEARDPDTLDPAERDAPVPEIRTMAELPALADRHFDDRVKAAVDDLPEVYRVPFVLFVLGGQSYDEIARALGVPEGTVMSRLHRARARLRDRLSRPGEDGR